MSGKYVTLAASADGEYEVSRSRFLTRLVRVDTELAAREVIAAVRAEHPRARHHCSAFVLGDAAQVQRSNDDGEPSGTAGAPMLDALLSSGVSDVVAVVTRYFGGVLLGAGGLTRAYRAAVAETVQSATLVTRAMRHTVVVRSSYECAAQITAEARRRGIGVGEAEYGADVAQELLLAPEQLTGAEGFVAELSAGSATLHIRATGYIDLR